MKRWLVLVLLLYSLTVQSCSRVSTNKLQPFLDKPIDLSTIEVVEHPGTVLETMSACNGKAWDHGEYGVLLFSAGMQMGCCYLSGPEYGKVERCDIWYPAGWEGIRSEELLHCQGYMDFF